MVSGCKAGRQITARMLVVNPTAMRKRIGVRSAGNDGFMGNDANMIFIFYHVFLFFYTPAVIRKNKASSR